MTTKKKLLTIGAVAGILLTAFIFMPGGLKGKFLSSNAVYVDGEACPSDAFKCTDTKMCVDTFFSNGQKIKDIAGSKASAGNNKKSNVMLEASYLKYTIPDTFRTGDKINLVYDTRPCGTAGITGVCTNWTQYRYIVLPITIGEKLPNSATPNSPIYALAGSKSAYFYAQYDISTRKVTAHLEYHGKETDGSALSLVLKEVSGAGSACLSPLYSTMTNWAKPAGFSPRVCDRPEDKCTVYPTKFTIDAPKAESQSRTVPVTFTASAATGENYLITESSSRPNANDPDWKRIAPTSYKATSDGLKTLYAWVKDAADNVSTVKLTDTVTIDTVSPSITKVTSVKNNGSYSVGATIPVVIEFSEPIKESNLSTPYLAVGNGAGGGVLIGTTYGGIDAATKTKMTFNYTVAAGENFAPLGTKTFTAVITDNLGNPANINLPTATATSLAGQNIIIDTITPQAPTHLDLQAASDTGISNTDNITSDTTPSITLKCEPNSTVKLYKNDQPLIEAPCTVASEGAITLTAPSALTDGTYSLIATQADMAGNKSLPSAPLSITIDTVAPAVPVVTSPAASATITTTTPTFTGTAESGSTVQVTLGANIYTGVATAGAYSIALSAGLVGETHTASVKTTDVAGNTSTTTMRDFKINVATGTPTCTGTRPANSVIKQGIGSSNISKPWIYDPSSTDPCVFQCETEMTYNPNNTCTTSISIKSIGSDTTAPYTTTDVTPDIVVNTPAATTQVTINGFTCIGISNVLTQETEYTCTRTTAYTNGDQTVTINATIPGGNRTINATFTVNAPATYIITYNANGATGGSVSTDQTKTHAVDLTLATNTGILTKTGYDFVGWNTTANGNGTSYAAGAKYSANAAVTLYAKWTATITNTTTVTVPAIADMVYSTSAQNIALKATFANNVNTTINAGTVSFQVKNAAGTLIGTEKTETVVPASTQEVTASYVLPANTPVGTYTVIATYTPPTGSPSFVTGSGTSTFKIIANTTPPIVISVTSTKATGAYKAGTVIPIAIKFSEPVTVTGIPTLLLETGASDTFVAYKSGSLSDTLLFEYTVSAGNTSSDLSYIGVNSLTLPSGVTIKDADTNNAIVTLPALDASGSLKSNATTIVIDTTVPARPDRPTVVTKAGVSSLAGGAVVDATDNTSVAFTAACTPGDTVTIYDDVEFLTSALCTTGTSVTIPLTLVQEAALYFITSRVTDAAGNVSDTSPTVILTKEDSSQHGAPGTPDLVSLFDLGASATDNITSETRPEFTVSCISGAIVSLYNGTNTTPIGTSACMAGTAMITASPALAAGTYSISAKQVTGTGTASNPSTALSVTIETALLNVIITKAVDQADPSTTPSLKFTATFSRAIDANSFICSDMAMINGACTSITALSATTYTINVTATTPGINVKATLYPGRVQTVAGNVNTENTGLNTIMYGLGSAPEIAVNGQCSTTLKKFPTSTPTATSLKSKTLCEKGTAGTVSYSAAKGEWGYTCRGTNNGTNAVCAVKRSFDSAPIACTPKVVAELPFDSCTLNTSTMYNYQKYLSCLNVIPAKKSCADAGCTINAKRQELIYIAARMRGIPLDESTYDCQNNQNDTVKGVPTWVCEVAEKSQVAGLISATNKSFRPLDPMSRAEAYSVLMKTICVHPKTTSQNWQTEVAKAAKTYGFTTRTVATFDPNMPILRQELWILASRIAQWGNEHPDNCPALSDELLCE